MARTTKIACEGAIYTVRSDGYGTVIEADVDASAEVPPESDDSMREERARYARVLQELTEFEEAVAKAEAQDLFVERLDEDVADYEEPDSSS
jgi:hypothetical protein